MHAFYRFILENMWLVNNDKMNNQYLQKKQDMKDQGRSQQELKESYVFNLCSDMRIASNLCRFHNTF